MNTELFADLLATMAAHAGNRLIDNAAACDLLTHFGKAEDVWAMLEPVEDDTEGWADDEDQPARGW